MEELFLIAGLGNPGAEYAMTRHNAGFMVVEKLGVELGAVWKNESKFKSLVARVGYRASKVVLCKPQTYMNVSGAAVMPV